MDDINKDNDYQEFFAGIKELAKRLMQIRERRAAAMSQAMDEEQQHKVQEAPEWFAAKRARGN